MALKFKKYFLAAVWVILPTVGGAILGSYLNLSWILFVSIAASTFIFFACWFFYQRFNSLDTAVGVLKNRMGHIEEALGTSECGEQLSWSSFWSKVQQLAAKIEGSNFDPDIVISVGRSGAVVGGMVASILGSKKHIGFDRLVVITKSPDFPEERDIEIDNIVKPNKDVLMGKKILCVMSECATGNTLHVIHRYFREIPDVEIKTAVIFCKLNVTCSPDFFVDLAEQWPALPFRIEGKWRNYYPRIEKVIS